MSAKYNEERTSYVCVDADPEADPGASGRIRIRDDSYSYKKARMLPVQAMGDRDQGNDMDGFNPGQKIHCRVCSEPKPAISCPAINAASQRTFTCNNGYKYGSTCTATCASAYVLNGASVVSCKANGQWSSSPSGVSCTAPTTVNAPRPPCLRRAIPCVCACLVQVRTVS